MKASSLILGIETSCDETGAAVVSGGRRILSNVTASSLREHRRYGGIIPEIASRRQIELIYPVVEEALDKAGCRLRDIQAVAVTRDPGLVGSLLVGLTFARALGYAAGRPVIEVDHIKAHLYAAFLSPPSAERPVPRLPAAGLVVSGGHTSLYLIRSLRQFRLLGQTRDDAAGEAFDKAARILGLGYPGGPAIDRIARRVRTSTIRFSCAALPETLDFSFSGIKTAVLYYTRRHQGKVPAAEAAWAFQESVVDILVKKSIAACLKCRVRTLVIGGGVASNSALRLRLSRQALKEGIDVFSPPLDLCVDNAAMIAGYGWHLMRKKGA